MSTSVPASLSRNNLPSCRIPVPDPLRTLLLCLGLTVLAACDTSVDTGSTAEFRSLLIDKPFAEVIEDLEFAITERNYRVVNTLEIGEAIQARGHENFPDSSVILFCNLDFARQMLEIEPDYLNHCPARISVRQTPQGVLTSGHLFPKTGYNAALDKLISTTNTDISDIIDYASRSWLTPEEK